MQATARHPDLLGRPPDFIWTERKGGKRIIFRAARNTQYILHIMRNQCLQEINSITVEKKSPVK